MTQQEVVAECEAAFLAGKEQAAALADLTDDVLHRRPPGGEWTILQIVEHLVLAGQPYEAGIQSAIAAAPPRRTEEHRQTLIGKAICQAAGPEGNAAAPKGMHPSADPGRDVLQAYGDHCDRMIGLAQQASGLELSGAKLKIPIMPLLSMNLGDALRLHAGHQVRHLRQIQSALQLQSTE